MRDSAKSRGQQARAADEGPLVVDAGWILRALAVLVGVALFCGYLTFCGLFYQGQWQLVLHPVRTEARPALPGGPSYEVVRFGPDATGVPQRVGWWIPPAGSGGALDHLTILYLPSGDGSLAGQTGLLSALSKTGAAVFALDWRGYGASAMLRRPSEASMRADAEAAWQYLVATRKVDGCAVVPYGRDLGGTIALWLAGEHPVVPALVLDAPRFDVTRAVAADPRVRLLPVRLLLRDRFELEPMLRQSRVPKLIVTRGGRDDRRAAEAGDPKVLATLPAGQEVGAAATDLLRQFLERYASAGAQGGAGERTEGGRDR